MKTAEQMNEDVIRELRMIQNFLFKILEENQKIKKEVEELRRRS
jgi:regulator of replication initiation timing